jgi:hypothetical protein
MMQNLLDSKELLERLVMRKDLEMPVLREKL